MDIELVFALAGIFFIGYIMGALHMFRVFDDSEDIEERDS